MHPRKNERSRAAGAHHLIIATNNESLGVFVGVGGQFIPHMTCFGQSEDLQPEKAGLNGHQIDCNGASHSRIEAVICSL
jgi:hypothetical protein